MLKGNHVIQKIVYPTLKETIDLIKRHGGTVVLAHPGNNLKGKFEIFDEMVELGVEGVEAFSNYHSPEKQLNISIKQEKNIRF